MGFILSTAGLRHPHVRDLNASILSPYVPASLPRQQPSDRGCEVPDTSYTLLFFTASNLALTRMQAANRLQKALKTGSGLTFGAWQMLPGSNQARTIARCGFDWVCVDTEHGNIDGTKSTCWLDINPASTSGFLTPDRQRHARGRSSDRSLWC